MNTKTRRPYLAALALAAGIAATGVSAHGAGSPWLPAPGGGSVNISFVSQYANEFYRVTEKVPTPGNGANLAQQTIWVDGTYGVSDAVALDFRVGGARSDFATGAGIPTPQESFSGLADMNAGIVWRVTDEVVSNAPSIALRAGVIVGGDYQTGYINSLGDGGDGVEVSAMMGKFVAERMALSGEIGYRYRNAGIPSDTFVRLGTGVLVGGGVGLSLNYEFVNGASSGLDIGGPGFSPDRFPELQEDIQLLGGSASIPVSEQSTITLAYASVLSGRNTAASNVISVTFGYSF